MDVWGLGSRWSWRENGFVALREEVEGDRMVAKRGFEM